MKEVVMNTRAILVPVAVALVLVACREPASPASSSSPSNRPAFAVGGGQSGLSLHPGGLGEQSFARWQSHEGEPDAKGGADQALYFQKMVATPVFAAGFAVIDGLQGQRANTLTALSWEHRTDGWCGAGAPRWNVGVTDENGEHTIFLGATQPRTLPVALTAGGAIRIPARISRQRSRRPVSIPRPRRSRASRSCSTRGRTWAPGSCFSTTSR